MFEDVVIAVIAVTITLVVLACIHGPDWLDRRACRWRRCDDEALRHEIEFRRGL